MFIQLKKHYSHILKSPNQNFFVLHKEIFQNPLNPSNEIHINCFHLKWSCCSSVAIWLQNNTQQPGFYIVI